MIAMNYQLNPLRMFDMAALRERIPSIEGRFDQMPGIGTKAFLIRELGKNGSPLNQYAPFCLWADDDGAARFLWHGPEFSGVVGTYGRPVVQTWIGGALRRGSGFDTDPTWTVRTTSRVPADEAPAATPAAAEELPSPQTGIVHTHHDQHNKVDQLRQRFLTRVLILQSEIVS
ncbi:DUF4865 family protein [Streptomyces misionensis]|uniref:DUF4865 family protein n=1 Tax=Streptomyces misionensis TaxID=67331 RepID=UPI0033C59E95